MCNNAFGWWLDLGRNDTWSFLETAAKKAISSRRLLQRTRIAHKRQLLTSIFYLKDFSERFKIEKVTVRLEM